MPQHDIIIAGGGFAGIYAAWRLARDGAKVALVEAAPQIGGNLNARQWNGYWLDNGTHNFDMRTALGRAFFPDILGDDMLVFEDQQWATTNDSTWVPGFELPSFDDDTAFCDIALAELERLRHAPPRPAATSFAQHYRDRFGDALAQRVLPMMSKYIGSDPESFSHDAKGLLGMFSRVRLGSDDRMIALKSSDAFWDDRLGVSLGCGDARYIGRNVNKRYAFPARKGLSGFCEAAARRLGELGVDLYLGEPVGDLRDAGDHIEVSTSNHTLTGKHLFWSMPDTILARVLNLDVDLMKAAVPVGTAFFAFEVEADDILGPDYLHDYSAHRLPFRYNKAGVYSDQTKPDGKTYVTCEVPGHPATLKSVLSEDNVEKAWESMLDVGFLKEGAIRHDATQWSHPVAFTLPKVGWRTAHDRAQEMIAEVSDRISGIAFGYRGRLSFMTYHDTVLKERFDRAIA
ncbi:protoporphyrinogen/coproporphyrinogen oxidase [Oceaniglobus trochenteri]|uniref:protoporphyrinogen/coproporphyrinogen oxidase n=1 Tax=Oceaniglobus trochenteri TaxID=2763260 RepID=UPI001CFFEA7F|nr:FAD-dependent oxidoreductase [Oceaniglobus trochenteri]